MGCSCRRALSSSSVLLPKPLAARSIRAGGDAAGAGRCRPRLCGAGAPSGGGPPTRRGGEGPTPFAAAAPIVAKCREEPLPVLDPSAPAGWTPGGQEEEQEETDQAEAASLPVDLLAEMVLPRVPYRSLCRLRCVSRSWRALCSDPRVLSRSPQTLSGFFCHSRDARRRGSICYSREGHLLGFRNLSGRGRPLIDPSLRFLRERGNRSVTLIHCCNGILLCSTDGRPSLAEYIVCNPATEEVWAVLPVPASHADPRLNTSCLCFDPAIPSYFAVFVKSSEIDGVEVYSSETGRRASLLTEWSPYFDDDLGQVFFNGSLHLSAYDSSSIVKLDTKGKTWGGIRMPERAKDAAIGQSQGRLHLMCIDCDNGWQLSVWVLEDYASGQWTLKHTAEFPGLLGGRPGRLPTKIYLPVAIHPECNLVFFTGGGERSWSLMSYDIDNRKVQHIGNLQRRRVLACLPYIPCFVEWSSDGH